MGNFLSAAISIGFHGLALAMVLYLISVGLSVTMGLMGFVNLAHGAFAMAGGYVMTTLMNRAGVPFPLALLAAVAAVVAASFVLERLLYRRLYGGERARPGVADDRSHFHDGRRGDLFLGPGRAADAAAGRAQRPDRARRPRLPDLSDISDRVRRGRGHRAVAPARTLALRRAGPRGGRQSADGAVHRHQHVAAVRDHLRARQRPCRARRRTRRRDTVDRTELCASRISPIS